LREGNFSTSQNTCFKLLLWPNILGDDADCQKENTKPEKLNISEIEQSVFVRRRGRERKRRKEKMWSTNLHLF